MDLTASFENNNVEVNLESIIFIRERQLNIDSSFFDIAANEYAFLNINL